MAKKVLIMGAAGKDFHVFNTLYREDASVEVVAFTATQIPGIDDRQYPASLAGSRYPNGIPIEAEEDLEKLIHDNGIEHVVFAYSDVSYQYVDGKRKIVEGAGASFETAPAREVMIQSTKPVVAVCAVRTGCGKSQTTRYIGKALQELGLKVAAIRHPMPYGDLAKQRVQRFASIADLKKHECTIEEMEEYEPHIANGIVVYAGVDYEAIVREAEKEVDVILWDGGNNDTPFYKPDLHITLVDPHRPGHELSYYPGRENMEMADVILFNKMDSADPANVKKVEANVKEHNPKAKLVYAESPVTVADPSVIKGKRVLVIEDGPTLTHGGMKYGAGVIAAKEIGVAELVDPRPYIVGTLSETFQKYPEIGVLLPAMGYSGQQVRDLETTINATDCDAVIVGTPIDLSRIVKIEHPYTRVTYDLKPVEGPNLKELVAAAVKR
jgi:predicted GTPase